MKLEIELVPSPLVGMSLHSLLPKNKWQKISRGCREKAGNKCEICGGDGRMQCHEIWEYDDAHRIQRLKGFIALCGLCHDVKHLNLIRHCNEVTQHFLKVNACDRFALADRINEARYIQERRSEHSDWEVDYGKNYF